MHRKVLLRLFGAKVGSGVVFKPGLRVKFPWRLEIGPFSWIGEDVWIDNLAPVKIGSHCCISQGVYICTGNHNWEGERFELITKAVTICDHSWLAAKSIVAPGVVVGKGAILTLGSIATKDLKEWQVHQGSPAVPVRERRIKAGADRGQAPRT